MANGGVPRRLTFELMREMRALIFRGKGLLPDEIRCPQRQLEAYDGLFPVAFRMSDPHVKGYEWDGIPMLLDESMPADCIQWRRCGRVLGAIADLWFERTLVGAPDVG